MRVWETAETRPFQCSILYICYIFSLIMHSASSVLSKHTSVRLKDNVSFPTHTLPPKYQTSHHCLCDTLHDAFTPPPCVPSHNHSLLYALSMPSMPPTFPPSTSVLFFTYANPCVLPSMTCSPLSSHFPFLLVILNSHCFSFFLLLACCKHDN